MSHIMVNRKEFTNAIKNANAFVAKKTFLPVLDSYLLEYDSLGKVLSITSTNLEERYREEIDGFGLEDFAISVDRKSLDNALKVYKGSNLSLGIKDDHFLIGNDDNNDELSTFSAEDYPMPVKICNDDLFVGDYNTNDFTKTLSLVSPCASRDDARPVLQGIWFSGNEIVSSDGFQLCVVKSPLSVPEKLLLPVKALEKFVKKCDNNTISVYRLTNKDTEYPGSVMLISGNKSLQLTQIYGNFPDYKAVIPAKEYEIGSFKVSSKLLVSELQKHATNKEYVKVDLNFEDNSNDIKFLSKRDEIEKVTYLPVNFEKNFKFLSCYNKFFLIDFLSKLDKEITISVFGKGKYSDRPTKIDFADGLYLIMPITPDNK